MDFSHRKIAGLKMCLNHSQAGIEKSLAEIDADFRGCVDHPHQRSLQTKLIEHGLM
jgi:hypothetical protein